MGTTMTDLWFNCPNCGKHVLFQRSGDLCSCPLCGLQLNYAHVRKDGSSGFAQGTLSVLKALGMVFLIMVGIVVVGVGVLYVGCALSLNRNPW
ncbi:MAG: hypothetical protein C5B50_16695 [Verrucomicrobia bacterium]|nr:MAG: hypothetical protein C5B50_16695 [Verrucomicrobiota bacterium]